MKLKITRIATLKLAASLLGFTLVFSAHAEKLALDSPVNKGFRASTDPILITLGDGFQRNIWKYLHLEIDSIDVTEFISTSNGKISYQPLGPLASGHHQVRLVAVMPGGDIEELASWRIEIRASTTFVESTIKSNLDLQITNRVDDDFNSNMIDRTQGQGSYVFSSNQTTENLRLTSNADFIYNSQRDQTQNNRQLDVNEFNLKSEWSQATVTLGHQTIPINSFIATDLNRRGVSASYHTESNNVEVAGFRMRTEMITGFGDGLAIGEKDKRISGAYARINPLNSSPDKLIVTGLYLDGSGSPEGQDEVSDDDANGEGDSRAVIVESYIDKKRIYLRGEHAESRFDFDGSGVGYDAESDRASSMFIQYATERDEEREIANNWSLGFLYQRVGQWFNSLGNAALPSDINSRQLLSTFASNEWQINANAALEENNVRDDASVPVIETHTFTTNITYTPRSTSDKPQTGIFSNPGYTLGFSQNRNEQLTVPTGFIGDIIDLKNHEIALALAFSGDDWSWGLSHVVSKEDDITNVNSDFENDMTSLELGLALNERFSLSPVFQSSSTLDTTSNITTEGYNSGFTLQYSNNEDISVSLGHTAGREKVSDGSNDSKSQLTEIIATWIPQNASENKYGISYLARAGFQEQESLGEKNHNYQIFLGMNITWPATF